MKDELVDAELEIENPKACIDLFDVNVKDLGLLRTIAGAETLISIGQALEEAGEAPARAVRTSAASPVTGNLGAEKEGATK